MKIGLTGSTGFIGGAVAEAVKSIEADIRRVRAPRLCLRPNEIAQRVVKTWGDREPSRWDQLVADLAGLDVFVNAAGLATPASSDVEALNGANGVLPGMLAQAATAARVKRLVHVSSATVQGERDPLDEHPVHQPFSPYSRSKALGEELLLRMSPDLPLEIIIHRPTSVQADTRAITQRLVRLADHRLIPLRGDGDVSLPVTLVENVAAAIVFLATAPDSPPISLQPWEGMTVRSLFEAFGEEPRFVSLPPAAWRAAARAASWRSPAVGRRIELLGFGQRQEARALPTIGFEPPLSGADAYRELAERTRAHLTRSRR